MNADDHERLDRMLETWEESRRAGRMTTVADLAASSPHLMEVLAHRIRILESVRDHEPDDSIRLSAMETALSPDGPTSLPHSAPLSAGDTFDGYMLTRRIGGGGMGEVWEAHDPRLNRLVAVKFIRPELAINPTALRRFAREARAYAAVQHDNVLSVHDVGEVNGRPYLVMPLLEGETLSARLRRETRLPPDEMLRIGQAVATGLTALHARGLFHRDVKPANIWLTKDGTVKLLDLGLARPDHETPDDEPISLDGAVIGTPAYMSPEQADGREVGPQSDLFSLGVVLYQMATGVNPFAAPSVLAMLTALATRTPSPPSALRSDLPTGLDPLILGLLAKQPEQRTPDGAAEVVKRLEGIAAGNNPRVCSFTSRRRPCWPWAVAVGVVLVLCWVVAWRVFFTPVSPPPDPPTADEQVRAVAERLTEQPVETLIMDETVNGFLKNRRQNEHTFRGTTGLPSYGRVREGTVGVKVPYSGLYKRRSWDLPPPFPPLTETKTVSGVISVVLVVDADGVRLANYAQTETAGEVTDPGHNAQLSAKEAVLNLLRDVVTER